MVKHKKGLNFLKANPLLSTNFPGQKARIKVFGVPFDATSTYRTGSRFGPNAIREAFLNIEVYSRTLNVDLEKFSIEDLGNITHTSNMNVVDTRIAKAIKSIILDKAVPIILGGEHTISYSGFNALQNNQNNMVLLVFDAHLDLRDEYDDLKMMHATWLRRLIQRFPNLKVIHVGSRAATRDEWEFAKKHNFLIVAADDILKNGNSSLELFRKEVSKFKKLYISIDLDVLDPAYAPSVANPEACGISTQQLLSFLYLLQEKNIQGIDIVELCPQYDPSSITAIAAAKLLSELCCLINLR